MENAVHCQCTIGVYVYFLEMKHHSVNEILNEELSHQSNLKYEEKKCVCVSVCFLWLTVELGLSRG